MFDEDCTIQNDLPALVDRDYRRMRKETRG